MYWHVVRIIFGIGSIFENYKTQIAYYYNIN